MNLNSIKEHDRKSAQRLLNFRLPTYFKKIGWIAFFALLTTLILTKFIDGDLELLKDILRRFMLAALFVIVLAKENIEDERIQAFRAQAFSFAFLAGVLYTLFQPLINWIAFKIVKPEKAAFQDLGDFQILWVMLMIYLMFFYILKKQD